VVYCKRPFGGPEEVLRYLARYTHRVAISNRRLVSLDDKRVTFKWKDYRLEGPERYNKLMTLENQPPLIPLVVEERCTKVARRKCFAVGRVRGRGDDFDY
jgi:hypothetical protein